MTYNSPSRLDVSFLTLKSECERKKQAAWTQRQRSRNGAHLSASK